jgi:F0F1-type ATP synthase membrane subunit b/b'
MRFWTAYAFIALGIISKSWASSEGGHHGSITDLIPPFFNVAVLFGVLAWKIKGPLKKYFDSKSDEVANTLQRANLKSKEAQLMLDSQQRKNASLDAEMKKIQQQAEKDVQTFEKKMSQEIEDKTLKLKTDANLKIQADKKAMIDDLNVELLNQVIQKTKSTIKTNKDHQGKVSSKLLQGL